jgi:hypothetical protein
VGGAKALEHLTRDGCSARLVTDIIAADFCPLLQQQILLERRQ